MLLVSFFLSFVATCFIGFLLLFLFLYHSAACSRCLGGVLLWGVAIMTPQGALFAAFLDTTQDYSSYISDFPPVGATIAFMIIESVVYLGYAYYIDSQSVALVENLSDLTFNPSCLEGLDEDVLAERERTLNPSEGNDGNDPLVVKRLRKVFPPKRQGQRAVIATEDIAFKVKSGEIFGLLGANGTNDMFYCFFVVLFFFLFVCVFALVFFFLLSFLCRCW
jgi:hypothetical protein